MKLLIRMPTYRRPKEVLELIPRYYELLSRQVDIEFIVSCDTSDELMRDPALRGRLASFPNLSIQHSEFSGKIDAYNGHMDVCSDWDVAMITSDDMVPVEKGFDRIIVEEMQQRFPDTDGALHFDDGYKGETLNTLPILGRRYYERFGYVYHPSYKAFYCDDEYALVGRQLGKIAYIDRVIVRHDHPCNIGAEKDPLYRERDRLFLVDKANFERRRARNFDLGKPSAEIGKPLAAASTNDPAVRLSVCMIVRDSSRTLSSCLQSIRPWVDEIVVVDTGSEDDTPAIAEYYGARLFHFPWCDDFSAARNESLRHARGKWLFWMDSDDTIDEANGRKLRALADQPIDAASMAYVMQVHCPGKHADESDVTVVDHVKMFRNHPDIRFEGRIHEQVLLSIRRLNGKLAWTDVFVVHSGSDHSEEGRRRKQDRDLRLLELELKDRPEHPFALFNLGMTYADMGNHEGAAEALRRSLRVSDPVESHVRKVYALLVASLTELERYDEAELACAQGRQCYPRDPELSFRQGVLFHRSGRLDDAVAAYRSSLEDADEPHFSSIDVGVTGYKARHNLAIVYNDMGRADLAELQWRMALSEMPSFRPAWRGLGSVLISQGKTITAAVEAELAFDRPNIRCEALMLQAELSKANGDYDSAGQTLRRAVDEFPNDHTSLDRLCQLLFELGLMLDAESLLVNLAELKPDDGAVLCNLGAACHHNGNHARAVQAYRRSIHVRPKSVPTRLQLGYALLQQSRTDEAIEVLREAEVLAPDDEAVQEALRGVVASGSS